LAIEAFGCATPRRATMPYIVGITYDLSWLGVLDEPSVAPALARDFAEIRRLGFNAVFASGVRQADWERTWSAAQHSGLWLAWNTPELSRYTMAGELPLGYTSIDTYLATLEPISTASGTGAPPRTAPAQSWILDLGVAADSASAQRVRAVAERLRSAGGPVWTFARLMIASDMSVAPGVSFWTPASAGRFDQGADGTAAVSPMLTLSIAKRRDEPEAGPGALWLGAYHAGLEQGQCGGLLIDRFRSVSYPSEGLVDGDHLPAPAAATAVKRITTRATGWGPRLRGMSPAPVESINVDTVRAVLMTGHSRRYLLLLNPSTSNFVHAQVLLTVRATRVPVTRAVAVPSDAHALAAEVVANRHGALTFDLNLAPGDAALYEIF
jgi:hypothetical protein